MDKERKKKKLQRILDSIWVADLRRCSPWQCPVGLPHSQKPTSCVGVRCTDWNSPQSPCSALTDMQRVDSVRILYGGEKNRLHSLSPDCYVPLFYWLVGASALICGVRDGQTSIKMSRERVWMPLLLTAVICWILLKEITEMGLILQNVLYSNLKNICSCFWLPDWQPSDSSLLTGRLWYEIVAHKTDSTYRAYFKSSNEWNTLPFCPPETIRKCEIDVLATGQPH